MENISVELALSIGSIIFAAVFTYQKLHNKLIREIDAKNRDQDLAIQSTASAVKSLTKRVKYLLLVQNEKIEDMKGYLANNTDFHRRNEPKVNTKIMQDFLSDDGMTSVDFTEGEDLNDQTFH